MAVIKFRDPVTGEYGTVDALVVGGGGTGGNVLVVQSLDQVPEDTEDGTVIVVASNAPPYNGAPPTVVSTSTAGASAASYTITKPTGLQDGDLLVAFTVSQASSGITDVTLPEGFADTAWPHTITTQLRFNHVAIKQVTDAASEPADYTFTQVGAGTPRTIGIMVALRGVSPTAPVAAYAEPSTKVPFEEPEVPSAPVPVDNCLVLGMVHTSQLAAASTTITVPGWTPVAQFQWTVGDQATRATETLAIVSKAFDSGVSAAAAGSSAAGTAVQMNASAAVVVRW